MIEFFICVILVALAAAFVIFLAKKWGLVEYVQVNGNDFFAKMFNCDFCLSWWTAVTMAITIFLTTGKWSYLFIPFFSTMITRYIL